MASSSSSSQSEAMPPQRIKSALEAFFASEKDESVLRFIHAVLGDPEEYAKLPSDQRVKWAGSQPMTLGLIFAARAKLLEAILIREGVDIQKYPLYAAFMLQQVLSEDYLITFQDPRTFGRLAIPYKSYFSKDSPHLTAAPCAQCVLSKAQCDLKHPCANCTQSTLICRPIKPREAALSELLSATPLHPTSAADTTASHAASHEQPRSPARVDTPQPEGFAGVAIPELVFKEEDVEDPTSGGLTKTHSCPTCKKVFSYKSSLARHAKGHYGEKAFKCTTCSRTFGRVDLLRRHALLHGNDRKWVCGKFSEWIVVRNVHEGDLPTLPEWGCHHRFARREDLERHFGSKKGRVCVSLLLSQAPNHAGLKNILNDLEIDDLAYHCDVSR